MKNPPKSTAPKKAAAPSSRPKAASPAPVPLAGVPQGVEQVWLSDDVINFKSIFMFAPQQRIDVIKRGIPAEHVGVLSAKMEISKDSLMGALGLSRATINRKVRERKVLSQDETERVLGVESLIGQVEEMVKTSGNADHFNAAKWVSGWLSSPLPALGGKTPASYMDTIEGQKLVAGLLAMAQSGAYA